MHLLDATQALGPEIRARADEIERARRLPADLAATIAAAGLFRSLRPASLGGLECEPALALESMRRVARADASAGWCVMIAATTGLSASRLPRDAARRIYATPETITGGVFAPMGRATDEGDHWRVTGRWRWASGSANCAWFGGGCLIADGDGVRRHPDGSPDARMMYFPLTDATLHDTWQVTGLCGTGSGDIEVRDLVVPKSHAVSLTHDAPREPGPLYRFPVFGLLALGIAAVMVGNAEGAVDDFVALATAKRPAGSRRTLAERGNVQAEVAKAQAMLRAAQAFVCEVVDDAWATARDGGELAVAQRASLRLAATHAVRTAADVARSMYDLAGGDSVFLASPLQRRFRDAHVGTQHMMVAPPTWELAGRVALGLPTDPTTL